MALGLAYFGVLSLGPQDESLLASFYLGLRVLASLLGGLLAHRLFVALFWERLFARWMGAPVPKLLKDLSGVLFAYLTLAAVLYFELGQPLAWIWATSSALGIVLGLALRDLILDVFLGLSIQLDRPYQIGDILRIEEGERLVARVQEINWRSTRLRTFEGNLLVLPNRVLAGKTLTNFSQPSPLSRYAISFRLDPWVDPDRALRVFETALAEAQRDGLILSDPPAKTRIRGADSDGVEYVAQYWFDPGSQSFNRARTGVHRNLLRGLRAAGIRPFVPSRGIWTREAPSSQLHAEDGRDLPELLRQVQLFQGLKPPELEELARKVQVRILSDQEVLLRQGDPGESMFFLVEGILDVYRRGEGDPEPGEWVDHLGPGRPVGELSLLNHAPRSATLISVGRSVLFEIGQEDLTPLFQARPALAEEMAREASRIQLEADQRRSLAELSRAEEAELERGVLAKIREIFSEVFGRT